MAGRPIVLTSRVPAVDGKSVTNNERGEIRAHKEDHRCNFFGLSEATNRGIRQEKPAHLRIIEPMFRHRRLDETGRQRVNANSLAGIFDCSGLG